MPVIGFGTFQITDPTECERCVREALEVGYRMVDTAALYQNEAYVGRGIRSSGIAREEIFVVSKLAVVDNGYEAAKKAIDVRLQELGLDYLDMLLIHHPYGDVFGAWRAMEEAYRDGRLRAIGVSNFEAYRLMDFVKSNDVVPAVDQVETHPFCQQKRVKKVMEEFGIRLVASETLAQGQRGIFHDPALMKIAQAHGKSVGQVILRWHLQNGHIVIPKTVHKERMQENLNIFDFELTPEEMAVFEPMDTGDSIFCDRRDPERVKIFLK